MVALELVMGNRTGLHKYSGLKTSFSREGKECAISTNIRQYETFRLDRSDIQI